MPDYDPSFFEDEVRCGFYVPSMTKRAWAVEMDVVSEVDRICKKYDIPYFADWGTLLGTVRHQGFIPWDDDMDICMRRNDYARFLAVADELPDGYCISSYETSETNWNFLVNVTSSPRMCFDPAYLDSHYGFPYMAGVDIFFLDNVPENEQDRNDWITYIKYILNVAVLLGEERLTGDELEHALCQIEMISGISIPREGSLYDRKLELYRIAMQECGRFNGQPTPQLTQLMRRGLYLNWFLPSEYYASSIRMPFEHLQLPVAVGYDGLLTRKYGDYKSIYMGGGGHNYPFYNLQKEALGTDLDFVPKYSFSADDLRKDRSKSGVSLRTSIRQFLENLTAQKNGKPEYDADGLVQLQEDIITLGSRIEQTRGEGLPIITLMEECCEAIYALHEMPTQEHRLALSGLLKQMTESLLELQNRREVVFLPFKGKYWDRLAPEWEVAVANKNCDVYVIPLPFYRKKYDGTIQEMCFWPEAYPSHVPLTDYRIFDFSLHQPEEIYIQNPYDQYNMAITLPSFFYASNLKNYTERLIYKPWFAQADFDANNYACRYNMQYYCSMPGVVQADEVLLDTPILRDRYVEYLTDFAGADTRTLWEKKIQVPGSN